MMRIFTDLGQTLSAVVPEWALPFVGAGVLILLAPVWFETVRGKQIKGAIRRMVRAERDDRPALAERALGFAGRRRLRLIGLVQEAIRYGQRDLIDEGLKRLEALPRGREDAVPLRARIEKPRPTFRDPLEAYVRVERLIEQGLVAGALEQLDAARERFPDDPDLASLAARLAS